MKRQFQFSEFGSNIREQANAHNMGFGYMAGRRINTHRPIRLSALVPVDLSQLIKRQHLH
jgi:hypothetical protein